MNIFKLVGTIVIEKQDAVKSINEVTETAKDAETKLELSFSNFGKFAAAAGQAIAVGLAAGTAAFTELMKVALRVSGDIEQGLGGAEQVFGEFAENIAANAKAAFANMGLSMADYLSTANKMGSLFLGTGADAENAYNMTTNAMQRAADVAAIMGIDINWAMESIAGMAKGNYSMMDNLGVAMNDTTLKAYALEKGITDSWKEMELGQKIGIAYQMFMEKTAYAIGQYTRENETYTGSITTMKAAFQNLLSGEVDPETVIPHIEKGLQAVVDRIAKLAPVLAQGISALLDALIPHLGPILDKLLPVFTDFWGKIADKLFDNLIKKFEDMLTPGKKTNADIYADLVRDDSADDVIKDANALLKYADDFASGLENAKGRVEAKIIQLQFEGDFDAANRLKEWWKEIQTQLNFTAPLNLVPQIVNDSNLPTNLGGGTIEFGKEGYHIKTFGSHATGLDYVPRDNYLARLHQGEAVLTRSEADAWRKGMMGGQQVYHDETIVSGNTFVIRNEQDIYSLSAQIASMKREKRRGRGAYA